MVQRSHADTAGLFSDMGRPKTSKKHTILFVDDEVSVLDTLRRAIRGQRDDWNMHFARSVDEALERAHAMFTIAAPRRGGLKR